MKQSLKIHLDKINLPGDLLVPENPIGLVIFSHGSGSSRFSPRNKYVAECLQERRLATFLFDLLTQEEDQVSSQRFNIQLLSQRLVKVTQYLMEVPILGMLPIGYFGASTGAASALFAASVLSDTIKAVVSRGGRPDLAMSQLPEVKAPTLLIVGELDFQVITLNQQAMEKMPGTKSLKIIKGATHLFEEEGTLGQVAKYSGDWFIHYLQVKKEDQRVS